MMLLEDKEVRVIAECEGWSMVRRFGTMPFVVRSSELRQPTTLAVDTAKPPLTEEALQILEKCFTYVRDR